jgi:hypothetical protein
MEASVSNVTLSSGDGTLAVIFENPFEEIPAVICGFQESLGAGKRGFVAATSVTAGGFTITIDSDSALTDIDVSWIAREKRSHDRS